MEAAAQGPTRTCVGCGSRDAQASMIRLRLRDGAHVVPARAVPYGRSAYLHDREGCLSGIVRSKGLGKSLRATITKEMRLELLESLAAKPANEPLAAKPNEPLAAKPNDGTNETVR